jgi:hypothetical protein
VSAPAAAVVAVASILAANRIRRVLQSTLTKSKFQNRRIAGRLLSCLLVAAIGCAEKGPELTEVTGQVIIDGKPLTTGSVVTLPAQGRGARGTIDVEGNFTLSTTGMGVGVKPGRHQVAVIAVEETKDAALGTPARSLIPERYASAETSGLFINVTPGEMEPVVLNLTSQ